MILIEFLDSGVLLFNLVLKSADFLLQLLAVLVKKGKLVVVSLFLGANVAVEKLVSAGRIFRADVDSQV